MDRYQNSKEITTNKIANEGTVHYRLSALGVYLKTKFLGEHLFGSGQLLRKGRTDT